MNSWKAPITDRNLDDISNRTSKAFFNVADWLRINDDARIVTAIANVMHGLGLEFNELTQPTTTVFPSAADINAFITNIEQSRSALMFPVSSVVPLKTDWQPGNGATAPNYQTVNDWEKDVNLLRDYLRYAADWNIGCGVSGCGEVRYWQVRFRTWNKFIEPATDLHIVPRSGVSVSGSGLMRQNKWRSLIDNRKITPRCGSSASGTGLVRQNSWRQYR